MDRWFQSNTINGEVRQLNRPFSSSSHFSSSAYWYWFKKLITVADWWMPWISTNTVVWNLLRSFWQTRRTCSVCKGRSEDLIRFMINSLSVKRHPKRYINTNPDWLKWQMLWALSCLISPVECIANREWLLFLSLKKKDLWKRIYLQLKYFTILFNPFLTILDSCDLLTRALSPSQRSQYLFSEEIAMDWFC